MHGPTVGIAALLKTWADRDRFVLSNGHGSMLIYALLHLTGYDLSIDDLQELPPAHSRRRAIPSRLTPGVETTTGPLGQGITNAVGMALAESCWPPSSTARPRRSSTTAPGCSSATAA